MLRIGMTNPPYILSSIYEIAEILTHPNVYSFLHIPVQSGSNAVLDSMKRDYKIQHFEQICDQLTRNIPNITIATDIICGFPTETDEDFKMTMDLVKKYHFSVLNISQFYPRPGTEAADDMKKLDTKIVHARSTELTNYFKSYNNNDKYLNTTQKITITDIETYKNTEILIGHNKSFVKVIAQPFDRSMLGRTVEVTISSCCKWHIEGDIVGVKKVKKPVPMRSLGLWLIIVGILVLLGSYIWRSK